ncbi:MAG: efflux RND transporter periplasmic adaptor subunit [bacterium]|nr:efflux RND transporter periplasmic adaptor subunit [bacterium]
MEKISGFFKRLKSSLFFRTKKRSIITFIVVIAVGILGLQKLQVSSQEVQYQTAKVERGTLIYSISASGQVSSVNDESITTSATGIVKNVNVKNGDTVNKGDPIIEISLDSAALLRQTKAWADYLSAKVSLDSANTGLYTLQSKMFVANQKFMNGSVASNRKTDDPIYIEENADWMAAEANYKNQQNVIAQAAANLSSSWLSYQENQATVVAPISGTVSGLSFDTGAAIVGQSTSNSGSSTNSSSASTQKIASIKNSGTPSISINLSEIDVPKVKIGNKVIITFDAFLNKTFTGRIVSIDTTGAVSSGVTNYPATISMDTQAPEIFSNMSASANIIIATKTDVLMVPSSAIQTEGDQSFVRVLKNNAPQDVQVEVGISSDTQTEIVSGLAEGDDVITGTVAKQTTKPGSVSPFGTRLGPGGFGGGGGSARRQN